MTKLKFGSLRSKTMGNRVYLNIFLDTSLHRPAYIPVSVLEEFFKYDLLDTKLDINYWDDEGKSRKSELTLTLNELVKDCEEVRAYAKKYYPELIV